jgi:mRNA-degrading endonuclease RelE of RelBE toxin-antitoxin system
MESERFAVEFTSQAERDLKSLRGQAEVALRSILRLEENPELGHSLTGKLKGARALEFNLKRSGAYRALYVVHPIDKVCTVFIIGPHENIYAKAERRAKSFF